MKKFKLVMVFFMVFCLMACSNNLKSNESENDGFQYANYLDHIDDTKVQKIMSTALTLFDNADVNELKNFHTNVFVGTIDSIDGCSTTIATGEFDSMPSTYGKVTVLENLKGEMPEGTITFARAGGVLTIADYEKDEPEELIKNDDNHRKAAGQQDIDKTTTYMRFFYEDDIDLEAGKSYLFFGTFGPTGVFVNDGMQYGTREIKQQSTDKSVFRSMPDESSLHLKNNDTGDYESFSEFKNKYFK